MTKDINREYKKINDNQIVHINLSGWVNSKKFVRFNFNEYLVAYSSHSNYYEME